MERTFEVSELLWESTFDDTARRVKHFRMFSLGSIDTKPINSSKPLFRNRESLHLCSHQTFLPSLPSIRTDAPHLSQLTLSHNEQTTSSSSAPITHFLLGAAVGAATARFVTHQISSYAPQ